MTERKRAAVVLFVDSESGADAHDIASLVQVALYQMGAMKDGLTAKVGGADHQVRVVDVMEAGMAAGNGYLWTEPTSKAWRFSKEAE